MIPGSFCLAVNRMHDIRVRIRKSNHHGLTKDSAFSSESGFGSVLKV